MCITTGIIIANGRLYADNDIGQYTYCSHNGMTVVDYVLMNYADIIYISNFDAKNRMGRIKSADI